MLKRSASDKNGVSMNDRALFRQTYARRFERWYKRYQTKNALMAA